MCERQEQRQRAGEPYLSEALWSRISEHMTIHEWCKAAGTCKTSYNVPLKCAILAWDLPLEAWAFILKRCGKAVGLEVHLDPNSEGPERARLLMQYMHAFPTAFRNVKELRVSGECYHPFLLNKGGVRRTVSQHMALASMAGVFQSLQVLHLSCEVVVMPSFQSVRHLIVEQADLLPTLESLDTLPLLETLSLTNTDIMGSSLRDCSLDCRAHAHLQHVHLKNFAPTQYYFGEGCKVHGEWSNSDTDQDDFPDWAGAEIWSHTAVKSFTVLHPDALLYCRGSEWAQLAKILSNDRELDFVKLGFREIGTIASPLYLLPKDFAALACAKRLHLKGRDGCHVVVAPYMAPKWRHLNIVLGGEVSLESYGDVAFLHGVEEFQISCGSYAGPSCVQLSQARSSLGKATYCHGDRYRWCLSSFDLSNKEAHSRFHTLMECGCHACLRCLCHAGKLPAGRMLPKDNLFWWWAY